MVAFVRVTGSGQITIPADLRRKLKIAKGDRVLVMESNDGQLLVKPVAYSAKDLDGIFTPLPGVNVEGDFDDLIAEAFEDGVEARIAELNAEYDEQ